MTNKKGNTLKMIVSAGAAMLSIMSAGSVAIAADVGNEGDVILASESTLNAVTEVDEDVDIGALLSSYAAKIKNTYKERYPEHFELIDSIVDSVISDKDFIEYFERKGATAFQVIVNALNESIEPKTSLFGFKDEYYYSEYSSYSYKQLYNNYDGPSAAVTALMGSGCINYTHDTNKLRSYQEEAAKAMGFNSNNRTSVFDLADYLQKKYVEKFGQNTGGSFQARVFNSSNSYNLLSFIQTALAWDTEPVLEIPDRSVLYNHRNETGPLFVTVNVADDQGQYIVFSDPTMDKGSGYSISYDELEALAKSGSVWMASFG